MVDYPNPRAVAVEIINNLEIKKGFSNFTLNKYLNKIPMKDLDKSLVTELVYGYLRWKYRLTWQLSNISNREVRKIPDIIRIIILVGFYQIEFLHKIPDSAAVNESVNLAKRFGNKGIAGFVNGIMRNYIRTKDKMAVPADLIEGLAVKYSFLPENLKSWANDYDYETLEQLLNGLNKPIPTTIRINTLKGSKEDIYNRVTSEGIQLEEEKDSNICYRVIKGLPQKTSAFKEGLIHIQSYSSIKAVDILAPKEGETILDACSAPGGKTSYVSQIMNNTGKVFAWDVHPHRIELVKKTCGRLGVRNVISEVIDSSGKIPLISFDRFLIDAPCSGSGVITNKPEIKWTQLDQSIESLNKTQYGILENCARLLKQGGVLVYGTCSIDKRENHLIIKKFLESNKDFVIDSINYDGINTEFLQLYPHLHNSEGFFISKLKKL